MKRRLPIVEHVIRRAPRLQAATNRAIDAVLGKRVKVVKRNLTAEVEQQFKEAKYGST